MISATVVLLLLLAPAVSLRVLPLLASFGSSRVIDGAGLAEVPLPVEYKLANIEATEKASLLPALLWCAQCPCVIPVDQGVTNGVF